jgi:hypothetical protein
MKLHIYIYIIKPHTQYPTSTGTIARTRTQQTAIRTPLISGIRQNASMTPLTTRTQQTAIRTPLISGTRQDASMTPLTTRTGRRQGTSMTPLTSQNQAGRRQNTLEPPELGETGGTPWHRRDSADRCQRTPRHARHDALATPRSAYMRSLHIRSRGGIYAVTHSRRIDSVRPVNPQTRLATLPRLVGILHARGVMSYRMPKPPRQIDNAG